MAIIIIIIVYRIEREKIKNLFINLINLRYYCSSLIEKVRKNFGAQFELQKYGIYACTCIGCIG